jgi:hypothetical protein
MNYLYKLLYRNTGKDVMNALINSEAYMAKIKAKKVYDEKLKENLSKLISEIDQNIDIAINEGKFNCTTYFNSKSISKENKEYIKNLYKEKGYKVKFRLYIELDDYATNDYNKKIIITWKQNKFNYF